MSVAVGLAFNEVTGPYVTVTATGFVVPAWGEASAIVQRSNDGGLTYTTVRGLAEADISSTAIPSTKDQEYTPDVVNTYRAGYFQEVVQSAFANTSSAWPAAETGQTWDGATSAYSAASGHGLITHSAANTTLTTLLSTPTDAGDFTLTMSLSVSVASITGGSVAHIIKFRYVDSSNYYYVRLTWSQTSGGLAAVLGRVLAGVDTSLASTALSFTHSGSSTTVRLRIITDGPRLRVRLWSAATVEPTGNTFDELDSNITGGAFQLASNRATGNTNSAPTPATTWDDIVIDTGTSTYLDTEVVTPTLAAIWLKSIMRSFLNTAPMVVDYTEPKRSGRGDTGYVAGRTLPVAFTELMTGRTFTLTIRCGSVSAARQLDAILASGDVMFLHTPTDCPVPGGYWVVDSTQFRRPWAKGVSRTVQIPLIEVAAPGPDVVTASNTWDSVVAAYGTWPNVVALGKTWEDLRALIGDPDEVIVP